MRGDWADGLVAGEIDEAALHVAREAGAWGERPAGERRAVALLALALLDARSEGATRLRTAGIADRLARLGAARPDRDAVDRLLADGRAGLESLIGRPGDYRPFILDGDYLYDERSLRLETRLCEALAARLGARERSLEDATVAAAVEAGGRAAGRRLTPTQAAAIAAALRQPMTLVSGGPGTGKTALIAGLVRAFQALGTPAEAIAVAAPTGRAASRIAELSPAGAPPASTLHRLLGFSGGRATIRRGLFRHHENRPLPHAVVIVDEASMIGLALAEQLVRALRPEAQLVLVGDADQLPAVDAGGVFRDLAPLALRLTESHRMDPSDPAGAALLDAALAVAAGSLGDRGGPAARRPAELPGSGFATLEPPEGAADDRRSLAAFLEHWQAVHLAEDSGGAGPRRPFDLEPDDHARLVPSDEPRVRELLDRLGRSRILTVTRVGPAGCDAVNGSLARRVAEHRGTDRGLPPRPGDDLPAGTPVLVTRNDYERGLYNGEEGVVIRAAPPGQPPAPRVAFRRGSGATVFSLASLRGALDLAYASTVHKAQGSELDHAALLLPEADLPLLSRELVYTAMTRARRSMVVVGRRAILDAAVARPLDRASGLRERLTARGAIPATPPRATRARQE
jgi:exodeoxyribonuclease V alpha subunit